MMDMDVNEDQVRKITDMVRPKPRTELPGVLGGDDSPPEGFDPPQTELAELAVPLPEDGEAAIQAYWDSLTPEQRIEAKVDNLQATVDSLMEGLATIVASLGPAMDALAPMLNSLGIKLP